MTESKPQFLSVGDRENQRPIAYRFRPAQGAQNQPTVVWLGGFRSDMLSTKASVLDDWAHKTGRGFLRFDYSGNGESPGDFTQACLSHWLEEAIEIIENLTKGPVLLVGSSMGGWIALLVARALRQTGAERLKGLVLIAPAVDFTEELMWNLFPDPVKDAILTQGFYMHQSEYGAYPITRLLIEDGRKHRLFGADIHPNCPVHILQGMQDDPVPWRHALRLIDHLPQDEVVLTLIKDGDHRLSRDQDLQLLVEAIERISVPE
jgi:pimeloyl-ACP methyl ester carboxylesterase